MYKKYEISKFIFYIALFLYLLNTYIQCTGFIKYFNTNQIKMICIICIFFCIIKIIIFDYYYWIMNSAIFLGIIAVTSIAVISSQLHWYDSFLTVVLLILAAKDIDFADICEIVFLSTLFFIITALWGYYSGVIYAPPMEPEARNRAYLGFVYPGIISIKYIGTVICGIYASHKKSKKGSNWLLILIFFVFNLYLYIETDTRLAFMVVNVFLVLYILIYKFKIKIPIISPDWIFLFAVLMVGMSIILPLIYNSDNSIWQLINIKLTNTRLALSNLALKKYKLSLFGQMIYTYNNSEEGYFYIDSGYLHYILVYGMLAISLLLFLYCCIYRYSVYKKDWILVIWIILMFLYNLMNEWIVVLDKCAFAFAIWGYIESKGKSWLTYNTKYKKRMFS